MTILLVEDHTDTRELYQAALEDAGYRVVSVSLPRDALKSLRSIRADLVIMDIGLHGEGFSVAGQIARPPTSLPVIAVTGRVRTGIPAEDLFVEYLVKPLLPDDLVSAVRRVLKSA